MSNRIGDPSRQYPAASPRRATLDLALAREVLAIILIAAGVVGLMLAAFAWCQPAGWAVVSAAAIGTGLGLGTRR